MTRVVLVRPWADARAGGGCCGSAAPHALAVDLPTSCSREPVGEPALLARTYRRLRSELPDADIQVVAAGNVAYLLPTTFAAARRRGGLLGAAREAVRSTTAGAVLVDGRRIGLLADLGEAGVVRAVRARTSVG